MEKPSTRRVLSALGVVGLGHLAIALAACASNPNRVDPVPAPTVSTTAPVPTVSEPPPVARHLVPSDIAVPGATIGFHVDMTKVRASPAFAGVLPSLDTIKDELLTFVVKSCGFSPIDVVSEAMITHAPRRFVVAMTLSIPVQKALDCVRSLPRPGRGGKPLAKEVTIAGHQALVLDGLSVFEHEGMLVGVAADNEEDTESLATEALEPGAAGGLKDRLALSGDTVATLVDDEGEMGREFRATKVTASLRANGGELAFDARFQRSGGGDRDVKEFAEALESLKRMPKVAELREAAIGAAVTQMLDGVRYEANGRARHFAMAIQGDGRVQAGAVNGLLQQAFSRYTRSAKTAEARSSVGQIARDLMMFADAESTPARRRFPPSSTMVPASVASIKGMKYMSSPADWSSPSWLAIKFAMTSPQYYAYSFVTSRDGKTVTVIAQGDLNGDGVLSRFELAGKIVNGVVNIAPSIQETNPDE